MSEQNKLDVKEQLSYWTTKFESSLAQEALETISELEDIIVELESEIIKQTIELEKHQYQINKLLDIIRIRE